MSLKSIYVVSTLDKAGDNIYKIGIHSSTVSSLICRYATYLLHPVVYYFCYIDSNFDIESALKDEFVDERLLNCNNRRSEWVNLSLYQITKCINLLIDGANGDIIIDSINGIDKYIKKNTYIKKNISIRESTEKICDSIVDTNAIGYDIDKLIYKQKKIGLDEQEKIILEKLTFIKTFKIKCVNNEYKFRQNLKTFYRQEYRLFRYNMLFHVDNFTEYDKIVYGDNTIDIFNVAKEKIRVELITDIINLIIGKNYTKLKSKNLSNIVLTNKQYKQAIKNVATKSKYFQSEKSNKPLFFKSTAVTMPYDGDNEMTYFKIIQTLLNGYNIDMRRKNKILEQNTRRWQYFLSVNEQIKNICDN